MRTVLSLFLFFTLINSLFAQFPAVPLTGTELRPLHSDIIDQDFELFIKLPWNYEKTATIYPVLYTTDANRSFPIYSTMSLIYETPTFGNDEIIIVGIGYKVSQDRVNGLAEWAVLRNRDLRPERNVDSENLWKKRLAPLTGPDFYFPESGHAEEFLDFIQQEVIPFVEANYRVSESDRGIAGYSLGGLFTLYSLFHAPETFIRYFAGDPSQMDLCLKYEEEYAKNHDDLNARLLVSTVGSGERIRQFVEQLNSRNYPGLKLNTAVFENENHTSGGAAAISRALRWLYYDK